MPISMDSTLGAGPRLAAEAAALFLVATTVFDAIHWTLHRWLGSRWRGPRWLARLHAAHHDFCDRGLVYHDGRIAANLLMHVAPEYATQMAVCAAASALADPPAVVAVMAAFTAIFAGVLAQRGRDRHHRRGAAVPPAHGTILVRSAYHALHHIYPDSYLGSYTTLFDRLMGTACQLRGRRFALTGGSGAFGSALRSLLERAGAEVVPLGPEGDPGVDAALAAADVLVLAHGASGPGAVRAVVASYPALIGRFKALAGRRLVPGEVWAVVPEVGRGTALEAPDLRSYAREAARLFYDPNVLYRHVVTAAPRLE
jgi:hypothetical protein